MEYIVYKITLQDGLEYIGQTKDLKSRLRRHKCRFEREGLNITELTHEILAKFKTREEALRLEADLVTRDYLNLPHTLNIAVGGGGGWNGFEGKKRPDHSAHMKSKADKGVGHMNTPECRAKSKASMNTPEARKRLRENAKGNTNVRGRKWYNNGVKSFMLCTDNQRILDETLKQGRIKW